MKDYPVIDSVYEYAIKRGYIKPDQEMDYFKFNQVADEYESWIEDLSIGGN